MDNRLEILLIEDDADDAELTIHALKKHHLANPIVHIDDGEKALEFLFNDRQTPALILLDLKMPRVDGIEILRKLKSDPERRDIPVVALLSSKEGRRYVESFHLNADAYMIKPVDAKQFTAAITLIGLRSAIVSSPRELGEGLGE